VRLTAFLIALVLAAPVGAQWQFEAALDVTGPRNAFHHIEASGRQALAVSTGRVAVAWEDDRSGMPHCYLAIKAANAAAFNEIVFGQGECYAPGLAALPDGRFAAIWEDEAGVSAALVDAVGLGPIAHLAPAGGQGALAWHPQHGLLAAWSQPDGRWRRVWLNRLGIDGNLLSAATKWPTDAQSPKDDQMYPALAADGSGHTVAWEDRRLGHTVVYASRGQSGANWSTPARISQNQTGKAQGTDLGRGTGAMRPALAAHGDRLTAVWLDKRDFLSGYDVYAASAGADGQFGKNMKVQDSFGDAIAQWHPAAAGNLRGDLAVIWDDDRDGNSDLWLSWLSGDGYADNVAAAAGPDAQSDPAIAFDVDGNLHLAWVDKQADGRSGIRYRRGKPAP
jgi:hypothetical protein